jgi:hypothetical protein
LRYIPNNNLELFDYDVNQEGDELKNKGKLYVPKVTDFLVSSPIIALLNRYALGFFMSVGRDKGDA